MELDEEDLDLLHDNLDMQQRHIGGRVVIESDEEEDDRERIKNNLFTEVCIAYYFKEHLLKKKFVELSSRTKLMFLDFIQSKIRFQQTS